MLHYLLVLLSMQPSTFFAVYCVHRVFPMKHPVAGSLVATAVMDLLWAINNFLLPAPSLIVDIIIILVGVAAVAILAPKKHRILSVFSYAVLTTAILLSINLLGQISMSFCPHLGIDPRRLADMADPLYIVMSLVVGLICVPILFFLADIMKRALGSFRESAGLLWFLAVPVSQGFLLLVANQSFDPNLDGSMWTGVLPGAILCIAADIACILGYRRFHHMEQISSQVQQAEHQLTIQNEYYQDMQSNILQINQIRHDLNNQLRTAYYLLEQGHPEEVRKQLDLLKGSLEQRIGTRYCENLMVDAVLTEKAAVCKKQGIPLEITALVPGELPIEGAHLCSTFSNILDNSIAGTEKSGNAQQPIRLYADVQEGYLVIVCSNPCTSDSRESRQDLLRKHGLGLEILGQLAKLYSGSLITDCKGGQFRVIMNLKIR